MRLTTAGRDPRGEERSPTARASQCRQLRCRRWSRAAHGDHARAGCQRSPAPAGGSSAETPAFARARAGCPRGCRPGRRPARRSAAYRAFCRSPSRSRRSSRTPRRRRRLSPTGWPCSSGWRFRLARWRRTRWRRGQSRTPRCSGRKSRFERESGTPRRSPAFSGRAGVRGTLRRLGVLGVLECRRRGAWVPASRRRRARSWLPPGHPATRAGQLRPVWFRRAPGSPSVRGCRPCRRRGCVPGRRRRWRLLPEELAKRAPRCGVLRQRLDIDAASDLVDVDPSHELIHIHAVDYLVQVHPVEYQVQVHPVEYQVQVHPVDYLVQVHPAQFRRSGPPGPRPDVSGPARASTAFRSIRAISASASSVSTTRSITRCATPCAIDCICSANRLLAPRLTRSPGSTRLSMADAHRSRLIRAG